MFDSVDDDMSGRISQVEVRALFEKYGVEFKQEELGDMFECAGQDGQTVSRDELYDFLESK